ncbi:MAG TPA: hypothetical protein VH413_10385 [Verrucomicrobiae bacterium]|jgi:hypothetical protein|nr:hypothetical protein [Verrucomicrobiae bacterium]
MRKTIKARLQMCLALAASTLFAAGISHAQDFNVSTPNEEFAFLINGVDGSPTITLMRGHTYTFAISTTPGFHPFALGTSLFGPTPAGVVNNNISTGTITYTVPINAPNCVYYCSIHGFSGQVVMVDPTPPPTPPATTIVNLSVGTNVQFTVQQSTTNGFAFIPEANTNLPSTNWFALTVQSNVFANGTNNIWCGKPAGSNVFFRIHAK